MKSIYIYYGIPADRGVIMKPKKTTTNPDPWQAIDRFFDGQFPFNKNSLLFDPQMKDSTWIDHIVQEAFMQSMPSKTVSSSIPLTHQLFETHKSVIVKVQVPKSVNVHDIRLYVGATSLRIEGLPNQEHKKIQLPCEVKSTGIRSSFKDHVLEVRMVKKHLPELERQINITIL